MALTAVTVTGRFLLSDNETAAAGHLTFKLSSPLQDGDVIVAATLQKVTLDEDGAFAVVLVATDDVGVTPSGATYLVTESIKHADQRSYSIELPHADTTVDLADVAPVSDVELVRYVLASTFQAHLVAPAAHTAAHVSFTPPEGMDATDLQAALEELADAPSGTSVPSIPIADNSGPAVIDTTTYDNTVTGVGKLATVVVPVDTAVIAIAIEGDAFPRWIFDPNVRNFGLTFGEGTHDITYSASIGGGGANADGTMSASLGSPNGSFVVGATSTVHPAGTAAFTRKTLGLGGFHLSAGEGAPIIGGDLGDLYVRSDGGVGSTIYQCSGAGDPGVATWAPIL